MLKYLLQLTAVSGLLLLLSGCGSYKAERQEQQLQLPQLGTVVKAKGGIWYEAAVQIGVPHWKKLKVTLQEMPFNVESYTVYAKHMYRAGKINSIPFKDSLRYKPKYIRLQLQDKIGFTQLLNNDEHAAMRRYLSLDDDHCLVTTLDLALTEVEITEFNEVLAATLEKDAFNNLILVLERVGATRTYLLKDLPIYNYGLSAFCWGEDQYHNMRIENLVDEKEKCPKGTHLKAAKIKADQSYVKF